MVNPDFVPDAAKALEFKEKGNKCFQAGDWAGAEALYTQAIIHDPTNPLLYTNRGQSLLKLLQFEAVISDALQAISILPHNMKAYFELAQAQIALHDETSALEAAKKAHEFCLDDIRNGTKGAANSLGPITELVLKCRKEKWERRERERGGVLGTVLDSLAEKMARELQGVVSGSEVEREIQERYRNLERDVTTTFDLAGVNAQDKSRRRKVPDWALDDITFSVMEDPVVTKTGQSYERAAIMEHLKRSQTDPLTREPLHLEDLRPNLALKAACEEFLDNDGWAVDW